MKKKADTTSLHERTKLSERSERFSLRVEAHFLPTAIPFPLSFELPLPQSLPSLRNERGSYPTDQARGIDFWKIDVSVTDIESLTHKTQPRLSITHTSAMNQLVSCLFSFSRISRQQVPQHGARETHYLCESYYRNNKLCFVDESKLKVRKPTTNVQGHTSGVCNIRYITQNNLAFRREHIENPWPRPASPRQRGVETKAKGVLQERRGGGMLAGWLVAFIAMQMASTLRAGRNERKRGSWTREREETSGPGANERERSSADAAAAVAVAAAVAAVAAINGQEHPAQQSNREKRKEDAV
ncbi:hypothetical protein EAG_11457 [Camponotus floridanus]|uniref:Uncharacterized protein n=1 Tax=Camponotus floridanus TaxID=104421 RepID=E2A9N7_CAMFO|nr:hypothetical protein EAG_11457 [Camponotus floridanus]